jgi:hypothetical protein
VVQNAARAALVALALVLVGCGGGQTPQQRAGPHLGVQLRLADCSDWKRLGPADRQELIHQIGNFAGGPVGTSKLHGSTLPEGKAYDLFENYCHQDFARHFRLYRLYTRAAAFRAR